jgi:TRAP-type C4-dicarboxylate transport system substrate-binding protein
MRQKKTGFKAHTAGLAGVILLILGMICLPVGDLAAESIKFATLAPKGSTWMNNFDAMAREIRSKTDGELQIRFYPNGVQGDEIDVVRKMRAGLLHAGAMTATGLGEIQKEVLIFQLPRMFKTYEELDYVRDYLYEDLDKAFMDAGYVLLGMGDLGHYYIFSNQPIRTIADLQSSSVKMWVRTTDKIGLEFYKNAGVATVPGEVTQVMASLYSGRINAVAVSPYITVALQWYDKFKYMTNLPVSVGVGATVMTKEKFDLLSPDQQKVLREITKAYQSKLIQSIRKDNDRSLEALQKKAGIKVVEFEEDSQKAWDAIAVETHNALVGEIYSQAFLDKINALLQEYRKGK